MAIDAGRTPAASGRPRIVPVFSMPVAMMNVRIMRMTVHHRRMHVEVRMRFGAVPDEVVRMPVMLVVHVPVCVREM